MPVCPGEQLAEGRQSPRGDYLGRGRRHGLDAADDDFGLVFQGHAAGGFAQESSFPGIRLDQRDRKVGAQGRNNQTREPGAAAQVGQRFGPIGDQRLELSRIQHVASPDVTHGGLAHQVNGFLPTLQGTDQGLKAIACFT